jgi:hypothetical protein
MSEGYIQDGILVWSYSWMLMMRIRRGQILTCGTLENDDRNEGVAGHGGR